MKVVHVVGARPNFMKASPVMRSLAEMPNVRQVLVHTGQHYDKNMSEVFFRDLELDAPDVNLEVGSGSHAQQTAQIMLKLDTLLSCDRPDMVLVYGDVNSTLAASLVCSKLGVQIGHVEAGLRSFDSTMPEEINRVVTDRISDHLYTPSSDADENLAREGVDSSRVHLVGNVMIDTLTRLLPKAMALWPGRAHALGLVERGFGLVTLHRPSNVDEAPALMRIMKALAAVSRRIPLVFPLHPRTRERLRALETVGQGLILCEPLGYIDFLCLQAHARLVITDSGGIQEEATFLHVPCLTVRRNTERPVTVSVGTNRLVGEDIDGLPAVVDAVLSDVYPRGSVPPLWDGKASQRIAQHIGGMVGGEGG
jgi:UDP-N-acetylglucosamine 2-epimerase (non-hydrolysing)